MNPVLTSDRNACRFKKEFVPVVVAGRHHFFREADAFERADLRNSNPIECQRYQAALEAQKRVAKAKAERAKRLALLKKEEEACGDSRPRRSMCASRPTDRGGHAPRARYPPWRRVIDANPR